MKVNSRERLLLVVLVLMLVGCAYYYLFFTKVNEKIAANEAEIVINEDQVIVLDAKIAKMNKMQEELVVLREDAEFKKPIPEFDNSESLMSQLYDIIDEAKSYGATFATPTNDGHIYRRDVVITFSVTTYDQARELINQISDINLRSVVKDLTISYGDYCNVTMKVTFFEE